MRQGAREHVPMSTILGLPFVDVTVKHDFRLDVQELKIGDIHFLDHDYDHVHDKDLLFQQFRHFFSKEGMSPGSKAYFTEVKKHLKKKGKRALGYDVLHAFIRNPQVVPVSWFYSSNLETKSSTGRVLGVVRTGSRVIFFPETIFKNTVTQEEFILYMYLSGDGWYIGEHILTKQFSRDINNIVTAYLD